MKLFSASRPGERIRQDRPALYVILSFLLPLLIILIALAGLEIAPFGDQTLLIADANGLYINTLS